MKRKKKKKNNQSCKERLHLFCCWRFIFITSCWGSWQQAWIRQREELEWATDPWGLFGAAKGAAQREPLPRGQRRWWSGGQGWVLVYRVKHPGMHTYRDRKNQNLPCRSNFEAIAVRLCQGLNQRKQKKTFLLHSLESTRWWQGEARRVESCGQPGGTHLQYEHGVSGGLERWKLLKCTVLTAEFGVPASCLQFAGEEQRHQEGWWRGQVWWPWQGSATKKKQHFPQTALPGMADLQLMFPTQWKGQNPDFWGTTDKSSHMAPGLLAARVTAGWEITPLLLHTQFHRPLHEATQEIVKV